MLTSHDPSTAEVAKPPTGLEHSIFGNGHSRGHNPVSKSLHVKCNLLKRSPRFTLLGKSSHIAQELFSLELELKRSAPASYFMKAAQLADQCISLYMHVADVSLLAASVLPLATTERCPACSWSVAGAWMMHLGATRHARERGWMWMQGEQRNSADLHAG